MAIQIIKMPDIGEGIAEVELVAWRVAVGERVAEDQILADVMTDKATVEIPSHVNGTVLALGGTVGQVMAVGSEIIRIETGADESPSTSCPPATNVAPAADSAATDIKPSLPSPGIPPQAEALPQAAFNAPVQHALAAPAVRQRAHTLGINLRAVAGTGPAGRITHADLDAQLATRTVDQPPRTSLTDQAGDEQQIAVIGLRRRIAQKMQESKRHIPHFTYVEEIDVTELESLRAELNAEHGPSRGRLTLLPFLIRALVLAVRDHPEVNARYDDEAAVITRFKAVHLGLATQTPGGLMVPVLRDVQLLDVWSCAAEVVRLAEATRSGKAGRDELVGSTITLTSLGALGGIVSTPVINYPEVAIVGTNRVMERPVILGGAMVARKMMNLSSSFDHRVVDGMNAAQFIQRMRRLLEHPGLLFVS